MTLKELEERYPALKEYTKQMPPDIRSRCTVRTHAAGSIIHQKDIELTCFGIIVSGETRVINEFENGNVYMIERNKAVDFIGEVTILAGMLKTSVTIEAVTSVTAAYISRQDAERWLKEDMNILSLVGRRIAYKLYRSSYSKGTRLFYPPSYMLLDYLVRYGNHVGFGGPASPPFIIISKTRQLLQEELGINVKTLNRTIRQLKDEGFLGVEKGKITFDLEQRKKAVSWLEAARWK
nr:Crp/Fnr family transcriptional regulator [uncultured Enterocloster sp.]